MMIDKCQKHKPVTAYQFTLVLNFPAPTCYICVITIFFYFNLFFLIFFVNVKINLHMRNIRSPHILLLFKKWYGMIYFDILWFYMREYVIVWFVFLWQVTTKKMYINFICTWKFYFSCKENQFIPTLVWCLYNKYLKYHENN